MRPWWRLVSSPKGKLAAMWFGTMMVIWGIAWLVGPDPVAGLSMWDGEHYQHLAVEGYSVVGEDIRRLAFFPLYPMLAGVLGGAGSSRLAGILISQFALLGSVLLLSGFTDDVNAPLRRQPGFWLLLSPIGFFLSTFYTESLFLMLTISGLALVYRAKATGAATTWFFAGLTRPSALLSPALLLGRKAARLPLRKLSAVAVAPLIGMGAYLVFVALTVGDPLGYFRIQEVWWDNTTAIPFRAWSRTAGLVAKGLLVGSPRSADQLLRAVSLPVAAIMMIWQRKRLGVGMTVYGLLSLLLIHSRSFEGSTSRHELVLFPVYIAIAASQLARRKWWVLLAVILGGSQVFFLVNFLNGIWVA